MSANSSIEWTDHTFNPWWGCSRVSPGCENCYAETLSARYGHRVWGPAKTTPRRIFGPQHWAEPPKWNAAAVQAGVRKRVFCASMSDVFEDHPDVGEHRAALWRLIEQTPALAHDPAGLHAALRKAVTPLPDQGARAGSGVLRL